MAFIKKKKKKEMGDFVGKYFLKDSKFKRYL